MSFCSVHDKHNPPGTVCPHCRLERRERIATAVLVGFARFYSTEQGPELPDPKSDNSYAVGLLPARCAVAWADALIAELDKEQK